MKHICGDANPKGNIELTRKGGCRKEIKRGDEYRCTGCDSWFHKDCAIEHFRLEKDHDWGRVAERKRIANLVDARGMKYKIPKNEEEMFDRLTDRAYVDGYNTALRMVKKDILNKLK